MHASIAMRIRDCAFLALAPMSCAMTHYAEWMEISFAIMTVTHKKPSSGVWDMKDYLDGMDKKNICNHNIHILLFQLVNWAQVNQMEY